MSVSSLSPQRGAVLTAPKRCQHLLCRHRGEWYSQRPRDISIFSVATEGSGTRSAQEISVSFLSPQRGAVLTAPKRCQYPYVDMH
eukprot:1176577-Prorocentrum_minimum.AAC.5